MRLKNSAEHGNMYGLQRLKVGAYWRSFTQQSPAFKIACIYLMLEYVRPQSIWTAIDILPFGVLALVGGVVAVFTSPADKSLRVNGSQIRPLLAFFGAVILSSIFAYYPSTAFANLWLMGSWILAYVLISKSVNNRERIFIFYVLFLVFSLKMSQHGFRSWMSYGFKFVKEGVSGAPGWFNNSGEVGIQMCIFLPMLLHFAMAGWRNWGAIIRISMALAIVSVFGTIIGSSSRGALIGSAVVMLWMLIRSANKARGLLAVAAVCLVVAVALPPEFYGRLSSMGQDSDTQSRLAFWAFGWEVFKENPIFGIGYFNWLPVYAAHLLSIGDLRRPMVSHNIFVQAGSELGIVGLALVLFLIVRTFLLNAKTRRLLGRSSNDNYFRHMSLGLDAGMIGYLVSGQFVTVLYYPYLWIALAMTVALHNSVQHSIPSDERSNARKMEL